MRNEQAILDTRKLISGKDGRLFITTKNGNMIFLAEVNEFTAQLTQNNTDYQPVGSFLSFAVPLSYSISLTLTQSVVRDDVMMDEFISDYRDGWVPYWTFQGVLVRRDGQEERQNFRDCIPDGSIDLMNLQPGDIVKRAWSFRVNNMPELVKKFHYYN